MPTDTPQDEIKQSADELRRAADRFADRLLGSDVNDHLRKAAHHAIQAARSVLDRAEQELEKRDPCAGEPGSRSAAGSPE